MGYILTPLPNDCFEKLLMVGFMGYKKLIKNEWPLRTTIFTQSLYAVTSWPYIYKYCKSKLLFAHCLPIGWLIILLNRVFDSFSLFFSWFFFELLFRLIGLFNPTFGGVHGHDILDEGCENHTPCQVVKFGSR